nr:hypothetical protein [Saccharomonospora iraqiensis]
MVERPGDAESEQPRPEPDGAPSDGSPPDPPGGTRVPPGSGEHPPPGDDGDTAGSADPDGRSGADPAALVPRENAGPAGVEPAGVEPSGVEPSGVGPAGVDADRLREFEQFRRFQEFQRFEEFQRATGAGDVPGAGAPVPAGTHPTGTDLSPGGTTTVGTAPPAGPPAPPPDPGQGRLRTLRVPKWLRWLGRKVLAWLIFFLLLALFVTWLLNQLFGSDEEGMSTEELAGSGGGTYRTDQLLATEPHEAVRKVYHHIAQNRVDFACGYFDNDAGIQQRFAENLGRADCREAVHALHGEVSHVNDYAESVFPRWYDPEAHRVRIDSCDFDIAGGPALGVFTVTRVELGQWLITNHQPGPRTCPRPGGPSGTPTGGTPTTGDTGDPGDTGD